jgi:hypothetical protein
MPRSRDDWKRLRRRVLSRPCRSISQAHITALRSATLTAARRRTRRAARCQSSPINLTRTVARESLVHHPIIGHYVSGGPNRRRPPHIIPIIRRCRLSPLNPVVHVRRCRSRKSATRYRVVCFPAHLLGRSASLRSPPGRIAPLIAYGSPGRSGAADAAAAAWRSRPLAMRPKSGEDAATAKRIDCTFELSAVRVAHFFDRNTDLSGVLIAGRASPHCRAG